jgi:biopolymer transport protein ExbD
MKLRRRHSRRRRIPTGINLTSLLDAIFNLVFFFLLATTLRREEGQARVELPRSETAAVAEDVRDSIWLDAQGRVFYREREMQDGELARELERMVAAGTRELTIRGDTNVGWAACTR